MTFNSEGKKSWCRTGDSWDCISKFGPLSCTRIWSSFFGRHGFGLRTIINKRRGCSWGWVLVVSQLLPGCCSSQSSKSAAMVVRSSCTGVMTDGWSKSRVCLSASPILLFYSDWMAMWARGLAMVLRGGGEKRLQLCPWLVHCPPADQVAFPTPNLWNRLWNWSAASYW